jgi:hypothetical protein
MALDVYPASGEAAEVGYFGVAVDKEVARWLMVGAGGYACAGRCEAQGIG